jgi:hypothetical protein
MIMVIGVCRQIRGSLRDVLRLRQRIVVIDGYQMVSSVNAICFFIVNDGVINELAQLISFQLRCGCELSWVNQSLIILVIVLRQ